MATKMGGLGAGVDFGPGRLGGGYRGPGFPTQGGGFATAPSTYYDQDPATAWPTPPTTPTTPAWSYEGLLPRQRLSYGLGQALQQSTTPGFTGFGQGGLTGFLQGGNFGIPPSVIQALAEPSGGRMKGLFRGMGLRRSGLGELFSGLNRQYPGV